VEEVCVYFRFVKRRCLCFGGLLVLAVAFAALGVARGGSAAESVQVTSPNGSERWLVGSTHNITWTAVLDSGQVKIEYSPNGGAPWTVFRASTPNDGSEPWTVPDVPSAWYRVRVSDALDGAPSGVSDSWFRVEPAGSEPLITTKTSGEVFVSFLFGDSPSVSEIGFGYATLSGPRHLLFQGLPNNPSPTTEQTLGLMPAGSELDFYVITESVVAYSGLRRPPNVNQAFWDLDNSLGWGGTIVETRTIPGAEDYLLHLDRATGGIDDDNDFLVEVKIVPVGESPPVAVVQTPQGVQSGDVNISYTLKDAQGDTCTISVVFSEDGGLTLHTATAAPGGDGTAGLTSSPTGQNHLFVWDSVADIGLTSQNDIRIRITPSDSQVGTPGETSNFSVDNVPPPVLSCSPESFAFEAMEALADPDSQTLEVWNSGGGAMDWRVADNAAWLILNPASGQSTGEKDSVTVSVAIAGLVAGSYDATITVSCVQLSDSKIYVPVRLTVRELVPILSVSPAVLRFKTWEGGPNPPPQELKIQNVGGHDMPWQLQADRPWLSLSPLSGSSAGEADTVEVSVDASGLPMGSYAAQIKVTAEANSPRYVPVLFEISEPPPLLSVSPKAITVVGTEGGANPPPEPLSIRNIGTGEFSWEVSDDAEWLSVSPATGTTSVEEDTVLVQADVTGLLPGTYGATITVSGTAQNAPQQVAVSFIVEPKPPTLWASPAVLRFSAYEGEENPPPQSLKVKNAGRGEMDWRVSGDMAWVSLSPTEGSSTGEEDEISVSVDIAGLTVALYAAHVTVTSASAVNSPVVVSVLLEISEPPPKLMVSPAELVFSGTEGGEDLAPQEIEIRNAGAGEFSWQVAEEADWLSVSPAAGTNTGEKDIVVARASIAGLSPGTYKANVTVTASGARSSPQTVAVTLVVEENPPRLSVSPSSLRFSAIEGEGNPAAQRLTVKNVGGGEMDWRATGDAAWLKLSPTEGMSTGEEDAIEVSVDTSGLEAGSHTANITVTSASAVNSPVVIPVVLEISEPPPRLSVSPTELTFSSVEGGNDPTPKEILIQNTGGGEMAWRVTSNAGWLSASPDLGSSSGEVNSVQVAARVSGLSPGVYSGTLTVSASGAKDSPQLVHVKFTVEPKPPVLSVSPSSFSFVMEQGGSDPNPQTLTIQNTGGGKMEWQISMEDAWVHAAPESGTNTGASQVVQVSVTGGGMTPGEYSTGLVVKAPGAQNSPQMVTVRLEVKEFKPEIRVSPQLLEFTTRRGGGNPEPKTFTITTNSVRGMTWVATESASWLSLSRTSDTNRGEEDLVIVLVDKAGLGLGSYECDVVVRDAERPTTASVHVILRIEPIRIPDDYETIQEGIDAAQSGDVVLVPAGTYEERIRMKSEVEVIGEGADKTVIDCKGRGTTVAFEEADGSQLEGFTITGGTGERFGRSAEVGGGVYLRRSSPSIVKCRIVNNTAVWGGGICIDLDSSPTLVDCEISGNSALVGGGVFCYEDSSGSILTSRILENRAEWYGGGFCLLGSSSLAVKGCEVSANEAQYDGGGFHQAPGSGLYLGSCTVVRNVSPEGAALYMDAASVEAVNCIVWGNTSAMVLSGNYVFGYCDLEEAELAGSGGNISEDPLLAGIAEGDYHLLPCSPCLDAGLRDGADLLTTDLDGEARVMTGPLGEEPDIGADELNPKVPVVVMGEITPQDGGLVYVSYKLYHLLSSPCSIVAEYSTDGGRSWRRSTRAAEGEGTFWLSSSPGGQAHTHVWCSVANEGGVRLENVLFRITPEAEARGLPRVGKPFSLDSTEADRDGDRLPDAWERTIVDARTDDNIRSVEDVSGDDDFDGDGVSNREEFLAGTAPVDGESSFWVTCTNGLDGEAVVSCTSVRGRMYRVLCCDGLEKVWQVLGEPVAGTGDLIRFRDSMAGRMAMRFYRVEAE
jgi:hypothetical protein